MDSSIRENRRKVITGRALFILAVIVLTSAFGTILLLGYGDLTSWIAFGCFVLLDLAVIYLATRSGLRLVRRLSGATIVYEGGFPEVQGAVEDIMLATGMGAPNLMFIDEDYVNAFTLEEDGVPTIFFTHGLVNGLDPDELRAVIGHEMAHAFNEDTALITLTASLRGFAMNVRVLFQWMFGRTIESPVLGAVAELVIPAIAIVATVLLLLALIGNVMDLPKWAVLIALAALFVALELAIVSATGRILQRWADPAREMLADELAIQWTMHPEALARALRKVEADATMLRLGRVLNAAGFAAFDAKDDQPRADERIAHLEEITHTPLP